MIETIKPYIIDEEEIYSIKGIVEQIKRANSPLVIVGGDCLDCLIDKKDSSGKEFPEAFTESRRIYHARSILEAIKDTEVIRLFAYRGGCSDQSHLIGAMDWLRKNEGRFANEGKPALSIDEITKDTLFMSYGGGLSYSSNSTALDMVEQFLLNQRGTRASLKEAYRFLSTPRGAGE